MAVISFRVATAVVGDRDASVEKAWQSVWDSVTKWQIDTFSRFMGYTRRFYFRVAARHLRLNNQCIRLTPEDAIA